MLPLKETGENLQGIYLSVSFLTITCESTTSSKISIKKENIVKTLPSSCSWPLVLPVGNNSYHFHVHGS